MVSAPNYVPIRDAEAGRVKMTHQIARIGALAALLLLALLPGISQAQNPVPQNQVVPAVAEDGGVGAQAPTSLAPEAAASDNFAPSSFILMMTALGILAAVISIGAFTTWNIRRTLTQSASEFARHEHRAAQADDSAYASGRKFADFIDYGPNPVAVLDPSLVITSVNKRWLKALQKDRGQIIGRGIGEVLPWFLEEGRQESCRAVIDHKRSVILGRTELQLADRTVLFDVTATAVAGNVALTLTDLSEMEFAEQALAKAEQNQAAIINAMPDLMVRVSRDGIVLGCHAPEGNGALRAGTPVIGKHLSSILPPQLVKLSMAKAEKALATGEVQLVEHAEDLPGGIRHYEARVVASGDDEVVAIIRNITPRISAENEQRESERRLQSFMDSATEGFLILDADLNVLDANDKALADHRASKDQFIGRNLAGGANDPNFTTRLAKYRDVITTGQSVRFEDSVNLDGSEIQAAISAFPVGDGLGIVATDLTEQRRAEAALRESQQQLSTLARFAPVGMFLTDANGSATFMNERWGEIAGMKSDDALGTAWMDAIHKDDLEWMKAKLAASARSGGDMEVEYRFVHPDGTEAHVIARAAPRLDLSGTVIGYVGIVENVTAATKSREAVEKSEATLSAILDQAGEAIISIGEDQRIQMFNRFAETMTGYSAEEAIGMPVENLLPEALRESHFDQVAAFMKSGKDSQPMEVQRGISGRRKDGTEFPAEATISTIQLSGTRIATIILRDITQRRVNEEGLRTAKEQAEFANRAKTDFLANISHELRTPLNAIIGFSELLQAGIPHKLSSKQSEYASDIHRSSLNLLSIITDILDVSKIESGAVKLAEEDIDMNDVKRLCFRLVGERAHLARVKLQANIPDDLPKFVADPRMVRQILINLVSNAVKFTPAGGSAKVSAYVDADDAMVIEVTDTGIGMKASDIPVALSNFGQIDGDLNRKFEGTGLGLPLAKAQTELHGGTLIIASQPNVGTTVTVRFPPERTLASADF